MPRQLWPLLVHSRAVLHTTKLKEPRRLFRLLEAAEAQLAEAATWELRDVYSALTNPALTVSLEGFAGGRGCQWRHANGLVGTRTFGESELQRLVQAQHAVWSA